MQSALLSSPYAATVPNLAPQEADETGARFHDSCHATSGTLADQQSPKFVPTIPYRVHKRVLSLGQSLSLSTCTAGCRIFQVKCCLAAHDLAEQDHRKLEQREHFLRKATHQHLARVHPSHRGQNLSDFVSSVCFHLTLGAKLTLPVAAVRVSLRSTSRSGDERAASKICTLCWHETGRLAPQIHVLD